MKTMLRLGFVMATGVALAACSSEDDQPQPGSGGTAGSGAAATLPGGGQGGTTSNSGGATALIRGDILELVPGSGDVPYAIGANSYEIKGGGFLARAANGNTITVGNDPGEICISGNLEAVPGTNYSGYWGVEIGFNLNQGAADGAGGASGGGGGGAAGAASEVALPWMPGKVIGFSFVIEGPTINLIRFKALPSGLDPALESSVYCKGFNATSGAVNDVLFTEMTQYCWSAGGALMPANNGLANLSWQLPAETGVTRPFDWCLKDLRPILGD